MKKIGIAGLPAQTINYAKAVEKAGAAFEISLSLEQAKDWDGLILPGGGDILPSFYGAEEENCRQIDRWLDERQFELLALFAQKRKPVLGICKGLQIINVYFGGTLCQHLSEATEHQWMNGDQYHPSEILPGSCLYSLYGESALINSAHHQGLYPELLGKDLTAIQFASQKVVEGLLHNKLPILGVQWHPERLNPEVCTKSCADGSKLFSYFISQL